MADSKQLEVLKHGVTAWNDWRGENPSIQIDLQNANLNSTDLRDANLSGADLGEANLFAANLSGANLNGARLFDAELSEAVLTGTCLIEGHLIGASLMNAHLSETDLSRADLVGANLSGSHLLRAKFLGADLRRTDFSEADLTKAILSEVDLSEAVLAGANLFGADLMSARLSETDLSNARLAKARFSNTICRLTNLAFNDLSEAIDLESTRHAGPSSVGIETLRLSKGKIPKAFLRGCGLSDWEIELAGLFNPELDSDEFINIENKLFDLRAHRAIQISNLFISYSHADGAFVDKLEPHFIRRGIRFWRDLHRATSGRLEKVIDRAMRLNPTVLLVLSKDSVQSDWVEHEVNNARKLEKELGRDVLCPVALDDEWKKPTSWSQVLMDQVTKYNILDFAQWKDEVKFSALFGRLLEGLDLFYKK